MNSISIEFKNASKIYKLPRGGQFEALKPLNLSIHKGECFGLLGHNGAGKTTILSLLAGINTPTTGDVIVEGLSVTQKTSETKRMLGVVQQELIADTFFNLPTMLSIQSKLSGFKPDKEWIYFLLEKLLLTDHMQKTTRELSGGMKRRMMIARALVHKPKILVLDEPTAGVDIQLRKSMWEFIEDLHKHGMTIILTTHYLQEAEDFCTRIAIVKNGEIVTLKENRELLALGGKHKISCLIEVSNVFQWMENHSAYLTENSIIVEPVKNISHSTGNLKLSLPYIHGSMTSFLESVNIIHKVSQKMEFRISDIFTESPGLEDVFIKVNNGAIST
jgi:ABC-2 type transport system ATP-binding protein